MSNKVVHFIDTAEFGGAEQAVLTLLGNLDRRRWEPVLFCHSDPGLVKFREAAERLHVRVHTLQRLQGRPASSVHLARARELMDAGTGLPHFIEQLRCQRPLVFHAHLNWPLACKWGLLAAAAAHIPAIVATVHLFSELPYPRLARIQYRVLESVVHRFIAVSHSIAGRLHDSLAIPEQKLRVVHNSIPAPVRNGAPLVAPARTATTRAVAGDRAVVLTAARLHEQKGHRYLLEAAARIPEAVFVFAGEGPERASLEQHCADLNIAERVKFLGRREDVPDLLSACDVFVLPSLCEGLPLALLEAMAAGKPVIASAVGGIPELINDGENGLLVPPGDSHLLARAIRSLVCDRELSNRLAIAGLARAREFSPANLAADVMAVYDDILKGYHAPR